MITSVVEIHPRVLLAVETAWKLRHVDIKCELLVIQVEHLVRALGLHQVDTRANVSRVWAVGHELECEGAAGGGINRTSHLHSVSKPVYERVGLVLILTLTPLTLIASIASS